MKLLDVKVIYNDTKSNMKNNNIINTNYINPNIVLKNKITELNHLNNDGFKINKNKFAKLVGLSESTLYRHLNGTIKISRDSAIKYAKRLNCNPMEILFKQKTKVIVPLRCLYKLAVFELKYYYIDEDGNTDGKHYKYKGDHSSFCDGIDEDQLEEIRYK